MSETLTNMQREMLEQGEAVVTGYTNVAPGTYGAALHELDKAGLMSREPRPTPEDPFAARYTITPAGRAALKPKLQLVTNHE
jgi:DNA-binding PadR family transcriptional regulator